MVDGGVTQLMTMGADSAVAPGTARTRDIDRFCRAIDAVGGRGAFGTRDWAVATAASIEQPMISRSDIERLLDCRIIRCQYAMLVRDGKFVPLSEFTTTRIIGGSEVRGCVVPERFWKLHEQGATAHLRCVDHWHAGSRAVVDTLAHAIDASINAVAFLTPPNRRALTLHRDGLHLLILQVSGEKAWQLESEPSEGNTSPNDDITPRPATTGVTLTPGQVLAMRRTVAHCADALEAASLHVTFSFDDPIDDGGIGVE